MKNAPSSMLAAKYLGPNHFEVRSEVLPTIKEGEALVAVEACGFCGSDLNIIAGTHPRAQAPLTIGHELAGRILEIRDNATELRVGDRVTVFPLISCGKCHACTHGHPHVCRELKLYGFDVDGGMAQYVRLPVSALIRLPEEMPAQIGALIEPLAVAVHGLSRNPIAHPDLAVVLGAGPIGLLAALVANAYRIPRVLISDVLPARRALARELGLEAIVAGTFLKQTVMDISANNGADLLIECAGHPSSAREMTDLVRPRGAIVNLGVFKTPVAVDMQAVNFKELDLIGSRVYRREDFLEAIRLAMSLQLAPIISNSFPLDQAEDAFALFRAGEGCKVLVLPGAVN